MYDNLPVYDDLPMYDDLPIQTASNQSLVSCSTFASTTALQPAASSQNQWPGALSPLPRLTCLEELELGGRAKVC
eukprot:CAMPEP_0119114962 /NCGR_PEP_ID=MMETSP1180-20130426/49314_1 /TAXON_ID=3052 ORGANISM="Chlamydomonas cf sp, Strain CCMP681" /NCGR_SAMPLE_ID=MMETSP1180 /ASSEMBLY_ACC=CAM_ASM_000741 /LENGTH=74 /DNA_ID=CAMNT_0007103727 /DNA_START=192 /DNA_END=416 /DNA_ORIENTATION=+